MKLEDFAVYKYPRDGKCPKSCFADGAHRVGTIPVMSLLDGGASGDSMREICLECEKVFDQPRWFLLKNQPNRLGPSGQERSGEWRLNGMATRLPSRRLKRT